MTPHTRRHDRDRPRSWLSLFIRLGGWAAIVLGCVLVLLTLISATQLMIADRLDREGTFAQAVILSSRVEVTTDSDGDQSRSYYATFRFKDARLGGQALERSVSQSFYHRAAEGDELTIRYLRSDPSTFEYEIGQYRQQGNVLRWVGLGIGLAGLFVLWRVGRQANAALIARKRGEKRFARVVGITETSFSVNNRRQARLSWREEDGQEGESLMHDLAKLSEMYRAGDPIVVFRLGDRAYWEGDVGPPWREVER
jgi:hypothetical protein